MVCIPTNYVAFNDKINAEIDSFADAKEQIIKEIRGLRDKNYVQVLYKVYVQYKTVKQASKEMKKCYNYTVELHNKALAAFEKTYQDHSRFSRTKEHCTVCIRQNFPLV